MQIPHVFQLFGEFRQLVIVRCKQRLCAHMPMDVFDHRPRQRQAIISRRATADLV